MPSGRWPHTPQLQELRKKYKNDKTRLNEETMKFYKENGVNPLAGCLPMIPQMIVFFSLFNVLRAIAEWKPGTAPKYGCHVADRGERAEGDDLRRPLCPTSSCSRTRAGHGRGAVDHRGDHGGHQRDHDVPDHPAELQARPHEARRGPGQPDGPVAEVHDVHRPVLRADRSVLAVRPGDVLGDDQRVDARPAAHHVPQLGDRPGAARRCDRRGQLGTAAAQRPARPPRPAAGAAAGARAPGGTKTTGAARTNGAAKPAGAARPAGAREGRPGFGRGAG